ncbi:MAG: MOSC domain-containing protein [Bacteroidetes bacterium]|nr:MOSC domain-containing protein [Bacteroidota bacterium]
MSNSKHKSLHELESVLWEISKSPSDSGVVHMLVRRPAENDRELLSVALLTANAGLEGDNWKHKPSSSSADGGPHPLKQITNMNSRAIQAIAGNQEFWPLAGDQIYADINLSYLNMPPGTLLQAGTAVLEVTEPPHRGCKKFAERFGQDAMRFVNSEQGRALNLRGINCRVVQDGVVKTGDLLTIHVVYS